MMLLTTPINQMPADKLIRASGSDLAVDCMRALSVQRTVLYHEAINEISPTTRVVLSDDSTVKQYTELTVERNVPV